ncbi:MAG: cation transporter [Caulobacteraceae bacterium]|nr:cation transporter [Caulobacteraceae bacterium]
MTHDPAPSAADAAHGPLPGATPVDEAARLTAKVTLLSVSVAAVLIVVKVLAWRLSGSIATLASLADSALDLVASLATFYAVRYAVAPPDADHRYGHGKAEAFASLIQAGLVFASAALIGQEAVDHILHPKPLANEGWAMAAMAVSTGLTVLLVLAQTRVLRQANSVAVAGDRAHYAADVASNIVALLGIALAALLGTPWIDAAAGLAVTAWLVWGAISVFRQSAFQLMDHELSQEARAQILALVGDDPRILDIHDLRTRASGPYVHVQMHAALAGHISLEEAHRILIAAERRVLDAFPAADILIHADPHGRAEPHGGAFNEAGAAQEQTR